MITENERDRMDAREQAIDIWADAFMFDGHERSEAYRLAERRVDHGHDDAIYDMGEDSWQA